MLTVLIQHSVWGLLPNKSSGCWCFALWSWFLLSPCSCKKSRACTHEFLCKLMLYKKHKEVQTIWIIESSYPTVKSCLALQSIGERKGKMKNQKLYLYIQLGITRQHISHLVHLHEKFVNKLYLNEDWSLHLMMLNLEFVKIHWIYHSFNRSVVDWTLAFNQLSFPPIRIDHYLITKSFIVQVM